jgi:3-phosphoshikimate 1-carboxyvinyltransferase
MDEKSLIRIMFSSPVISNDINISNKDKYSRCESIVYFKKVRPNNRNGISSIKGVHRLLNKESNRAFTLQTVFSKMGAQIDIVNDEMIVQGNAILIGAEVESYQDHRIAMACSIAALVAKGPITITAAEAIEKSYTDFYKHLSQLGANVVID